MKRYFASLLLLADLRNVSPLVLVQREPNLSLNIVQLQLKRSITNGECVKQTANSTGCVKINGETLKKIFAKNRKKFSKNLVTLHFQRHQIFVKKAIIWNLMKGEKSGIFKSNFRHPVQKKFWGCSSFCLKYLINERGLSLAPSQVWKKTSNAFLQVCLHFEGNCTVHRSLIFFSKKPFFLK